MKRTVNVWVNLDWFTVLLYLILVIIGWINIYAAVYSEEHTSILDFEMRYGKQLLWIGAAILIGFIVLSIDTQVYSFFAYFLYIASLILLALVIVAGKEINGTKAWFEIGSLRIQPVEFAKVTTCLALAKYLSSYNVNISKFKTWIVLFIIMLLPSALIILQPDLGSVLVFFSFAFMFYREGFPGSILFLIFMLIFLSILALVAPPFTVLITILVFSLSAIFVFRQSMKEPIIVVVIILGLFFLIKYINHWFHLKIDDYLCLLISIIIVGFGSIISLLFKRRKYVFWIVTCTFIVISFSYSVDHLFDHFLKPHQQQRINILLGKESDPKGAEYNVNQSKIAIGSGGFWGKGFLQGTQTKFNFVPEQSTDFIFCTVGEEWGFMGSLVVISLFGLLLIRILYLSERQRSAFSRIYGYGVASILFMHIAINIGMTIGLVPVIGIPLPFFSYGGSSLWAFTILLFIFLRFDASRLEILR